MLIGSQEPPDHSCLQMSGELSFAPTACAGLLSSGGCGGVPALPQQGWWGCSQTPHPTLEKGFERENPLVSSGINHTWGGNGRLEVQNKVKRWLWLQGFIKSSVRETQSLGKGHVAWRGRATETLIFTCFSCSTKQRSHGECHIPAPPCHTPAAGMRVCSPASPWGINSHPLQRHFSPNWKNIDQDGFVCEKRQTMSYTTVTPLCAETFILFPWTVTERRIYEVEWEWMPHRERDWRGSCLENFCVKLKTLNFN